MICKQIVLKITSFLNELELICLHTVEWFQVFLANTNNFICTQLNGWLVVFYIISTLVGYLMANPVYT